MATPYPRQLTSFQPEEETILAYLERTNIFFQANKITEDKRKVTVFLNAIGARTYTLLRDLLSPATLTEKTFTELCATLKAHFQPKPIVIAERFRFHQRSQDLNKSVAEYIAELRKLALHCEFGIFLKDALRDRLVCGLRNAGVQKQLLAQTDLTLDKALQVAQGMEAAEKSTKALQDGDTSSSNLQINRTGPSRGSSRQPSKSCYRCGHTDHIATACRFQESTCNRCHKKGHLAKVCQSGQRNHDQQ